MKIMLEIHFATISTNSNENIELQRAEPYSLLYKRNQRELSV